MTGLDQKELGLYAVELNNTDFVAKARHVARLICTVSGSVTIDEVRTHPCMKGLQPSSPNTWGAVFHETGWRFLHYEPSQVKSNHARCIRRWEWRP